MTVRTRFAPSPTGDLHLGNARIAVLNWLYARHRGGRFLIRIEDTDPARNVPRAADAILTTLRRLGLDWDEGPEVGGAFGPYRQSERLGLYAEAAAKLMAQGRAFRCYCTLEELEERKEEARQGGKRVPDRDPCRELSRDEEEEYLGHGEAPSIRFRIQDEEVEVLDGARGRIAFAPEDFDDFVIIKSDGTPTYNFAVVLDDAEMRISHVIRGVGHLSNTPRQVMLYRALERETPAFVHVPHVRAPDGSPLSKRHGARGVREYLDAGYHPDALINYLSLLSWSSPSGEEVLPPERLIEEIDLSRIGVSDVRLDPDKLEWLSGEHIRRTSPEELGNRLSQQLGDRFPPRDPDERTRVAAAIQERITTFEGASEHLVQLYPPDPMRWDPEALEVLRAEGVDAVLRGVREALARLEDWSGTTAMDTVRRAGKGAGVKGRALFMPIRAAVTGATQGPELVDVFEIQGRETTLRVLEQAIERVQGGTEGL